MAEVVWRRRAVRHLEEIIEYLNQQSPSAAKRYLTQLRQACERLGEFPEKAPPYDERYRALVFRNHIIFHRFVRDQNKLPIVAVIDARRDVSKIVSKLKDT